MNYQDILQKIERETGIRFKIHQSIDEVKRVRSSHYALITNGRNIEHLCISNNHELLSSYFHLFADIKSLELRDLVDFDLDTLRCLTGLEKLHMSYNSQVTNLQDGIGNLTSLTSLDIRSTQIAELPEGIANLISLKGLYMGGTQIADLPKGIDNLSSLEALDMRDTQIAELPEWIGKLTSLTLLDISHTQITELPGEIGNLTSLTSLNVSHTQITELPEKIGNLSALTVLEVSHTQITELPEEIGRLALLKALDISHTQIEQLPAWVGNLTSLSWLHISHTRIEELPPAIYSLSLLDLDLSGLTLESLPRDILRFDLPFVFYDVVHNWRHNEINLFNTNILETGTAVFTKPREEIKLWYDELEREKVILNETRVILIGDGAAGKSTIIHRLMTGQYVENLPETKGVQIKKWKDEKRPQSPLVSFWDFGGQAIMHSMHSFFLAQRCLYVLILDGRRDDRPEYWLDIIRQYGRKSSVMVVMNKIDQNENAHIDEVKLRREYGDIFKELFFDRISCKTGTGFDGFRSALWELCGRSESCRKAFPGRWYRIKEKMEDLKDKNGNPSNYLREEAFRGYCEDERITELTSQNTLLSWLNDLGICFSYQSKDPTGIIDEMKVLRPEWITNGVYKIINSEDAKKCNGFIPHAVIRQILESRDDLNPAYKNTETGFILGMMRDFKLSYPVDDAEFIPMLTTDSEPGLPLLQEPVHVRIEYQVSLPASVLYQLVTQMKTDVSIHLTWRSGTYLTSRYDRCKAIIRFGKTKNIVDIYVEGENKAAYFSHIRRNLAYIQRNMEVEFDEYIAYHKNGKDGFAKLKRLLGLIRRGIEDDYAEDINETIHVRDILASVAPHEVVSHLLETLRKNEDELNYIKNEKLAIAALRDMVWSIDKKTDAILLDTQKLRYALEKIEHYSHTQSNELLHIFEDIRRGNADEQMEQEILSVVTAIKKGQAKAISEKLLDFVGFAGSVASLAPYLQKVSHLILQFAGSL